MEGVVRVSVSSYYWSKHIPKKDRRWHILARPRIYPETFFNMNPIVYFLWHTHIFLIKFMIKVFHEEHNKLINWYERSSAYCK
jgi:hypothetical protein